MYLILMGCNMTASILVTALLMSGPRFLTPLMPQAYANAVADVNTSFFLPLSPAAEEFLMFGGAPAILCYLFSCLVLTCYYRCTHTWRDVGGERDIKCKYCCCPSIGRLCFQENPVVGEIPFWEKVRDVSSYLLSHFTQEEAEPEVEISLMRRGILRFSTRQT